MKLIIFITTFFFFFAPLDAENFISLKGLSDIEVPTVSAQKGMTKSVNKSKGGANMSEFFKRLEGIGMKTDEIRAVTSMVEVFFRKPSADAVAEYGYILNNLYMPKEYKEEGSNSVRFDLPPHLINTLIHEYVHAARDVRASKNAAPGTPAREHYDAVATIRADLRSQAFFYRYSWMKADEVSAYFVGDAIAQVFEKAEDIIFYNTLLQGSKPATEEEALELGGRFILPKPQGNNFGFARLAKNKIFGHNTVYDDAQFKGSAVTGFQYIHWTERQFIKDDMYRNILGLNPPKDTKELLKRMNTLDNAWLKEIRAKVAKARLKNARKLSAQPAPSK